MREGKFIDQNVKRWMGYLETSNDPDEQASRFVHLLDDLSYSKTHYKDSKTTKFINGLAAKQYQAIYQHKKLDFGRLISFWKYELPILFAKYQKIYLFTLTFFIASVCIGVLSSQQDQEFVRSILGDDYVNLTEDNIQKGDPFGVYKKQNEFDMFIQIASNNIQVSFFVYALGILFGIATLYLLFTNGLMLGTFEQLFFAKGLGWQSILVVWIHGTIEIASIVIAGTAGLILGFSFLFPGTYTRIQSLRKGALDSVKIIIGLIPFFLTAAFLEGFITLHTSMPKAVSISILALSFLLILWYFTIYPLLLRRAGAQFIQGSIHFEKPQS
ncbi:MAG: stage II sporulation protein M [Chitinophagaceae bacterium]